jgi:hypothetical protein
VWPTASGGCHLDRPVADLVTGAGFRIERLDRFYGARPKSFGYFYLGAATPTS